MNSDKIIDAIGMINEEFIKDAKNTRKKKIPAKKTIISLIAALIIFSALGITSLAKAYDASLDEVLYYAFPSVAQSLKPVNLSSEDNGIKMEVVSADIKGNEAYIYVSMQDLAGNRIDETIDLYDSYRLKIPFDQHGICTKIGYDEETKKATFLVKINSKGNVTIPKGKVTLNINCFLSRKFVQEGFIDEIDLSKAELNSKYDTDVTRYKRLKDKYEPGSLRNNIYWFAYERIPRVIQNIFNLNDGYFEYEVYREETEKYLSGIGNSFYTSETGAEIVAMGFIDNQLHVKVFYGSRHYNDHIGFLSIYDKKGKEKNPIGMKYINSFGEIEPNLIAPTETWIDYTFDISPDEIEGCRLYGEFLISKNYTEGDWEVTFRLP